MKGDCIAVKVVVVSVCGCLLRLLSVTSAGGGEQVEWECKRNQKQELACADVLLYLDVWGGTEECLWLLGAPDEKMGTLPDRRRASWCGADGKIRSSSRDKLYLNAVGC